VTYLISRANYERCTEGMTDAQRRNFDRDFTLYPDRVSPDARIDLDRVAETYVQLVARETCPPPLTFEQVRERSPFAGWDVTTTTAPYTAAWINCAKGNGKSSWRPPDHWLSGDYLDVDALMREWATALDDTRRYYLNTWVDARPADPVGDLRAAQGKIEELDLPRPQRLAAGELALIAFQLAAQPVTMKTFGQVTVDLTGIPIVPGRDLPADVWQLIASDTGEVLHEGTIGPGLAGLVQEMLDQTCELAGEPAGDLPF
jgi:hypothetical protein